MRAIIAIVLAATVLSACKPENNDITGSIDNCARNLYSPLQSQGHQAVRRRLHRLRARRDDDLLDVLHAQGRAMSAEEKPALHFAM